MDEVRPVEPITLTRQELAQLMIAHHEFMKLMESLAEAVKNICETLAKAFNLIFDTILKMTPEQLKELGLVEKSKPGLEVEILEEGGE